MDESEIAQRLISNIPVTEETTATPITPVADPPNQAKLADSIDLDELTQYKLHDFFGEPYRANDEVKRQQLSYIYEKVSEMVDSTEYGFVVAKMRGLEQMLGITNDERKMHKMYHWLKLESIRKNIDLQMEAI